MATNREELQETIDYHKGASKSRKSAAMSSHAIGIISGAITGAGGLSLIEGLSSGKSFDMVFGLAGIALGSLGIRDARSDISQEIDQLVEDERTVAMSELKIQDLPTE